jgi:hypothetical protein
MAMEKTGAPIGPQMGKVSVPFPNGVQVYKAEQGCFVPQPTVTNEACLADGCLGTMLIWPDGSKGCQKCGARPQEK